MYNTMGPVASREKITPLNIWGVNVFTLRLQKNSRFFIYKAHFLGGPDIPGDPTGRPRHGMVVGNEGDGLGLLAANA